MVMEVMLGSTGLKGNVTLHPEQDLKRFLQAISMAGLGLCFTNQMTA